MRASAGLLAIVIGAAAGPPAVAEPLPRPAVPYRMEGRIADGPQVEVAQDGDKARVTVVAARWRVTAVIDAAARRAVTTTRTAQANFAVDFRLDELNLPLPVAIDATPVGEADALGQPCRLWRLNPPLPTRYEARACLAADGVIMRFEVREGGSSVFSYEATSVERIAQPAAVFRPPTSPRPMRLTLDHGTDLLGLARALGLGALF